MVIEKKIEFDTQLAHFLPRQLQALDLLDSGKIKFLLYGGALGGGKSYFLRWVLVRFLQALYAERGMKNVPVMLACEDYPSLKDRQLAKIGLEFPPWLGTMVQDHRLYGRCFVLHQDFGSGVICFRNLDDPSKYQSAEFAAIAVDELTKNIYETFTFLRMRLRWPGLEDIECPFIAGTNPGGIGHGWVKQLWMDGNFPIEWVDPIDYRPMFAYVPSKADDNPYLDASYWAMLQTLPANLRPAFREGNWDIFVGQAFPEVTKETHGIDPVPVPANAPITMTYDWGFGKPFSIGWWWTDADARIYRFQEWYGWNGTPDSGLRLADSEVAEEIKRREQSWGIGGRDIYRLAGRDCFQKRPDIRGGGQGPPTSEVFADHGIFLSPGDDSRRDAKIRQFREYVILRYNDIHPVAAKMGYQPRYDEVFGQCWVGKGDEVVNYHKLREIAMRMGIALPIPRPMMMIYNTCEQFFRTIPALIMDKNKPEDVDSKGEDHIYDDACHICMARPIAMEEPRSHKSIFDRRIEALTKPIEQQDDIIDVMAWEQEREIRYLESDGQEDWEEEQSQDMIPTIPGG